MNMQQIAAAQAGGPAALWLARLAVQCDLSIDAALTGAAELLAYPVLDDGVLCQLAPAFAVAEYSEMVRRHALIGVDGQGRLVAALGLPQQAGLGAWLATLNVAAFYMADPGAVAAKLESHEAMFSAVADAVGEELSAEVERDASGELTLTSIQGEASPAVKLINSTVFDALRLEASDIHLETLPQGLLIKFRIDGVLNRIAMVSNPVLAEQAIARVKVLAELDIGEKRIPQDGRFRVGSKGRDIDIRVSIMPSIFGEDAVLRVPVSYTHLTLPTICSV